MANEPVQTNATGQVVLKLNAPWQDVTTHLVMSPLEFRRWPPALVTLRRQRLLRSGQFSAVSV